MVIVQVTSKVSMRQHNKIPGLMKRLAKSDKMEFYQAMANPSHDMKKEAAKLNRVQDQESSIIDVKKSLRYLVTEMKD